MKKDRKTIMRLFAVFAVLALGLLVAGCPETKKDDDSASGSGTAKAVMGGNLNFFSFEPVGIDPYNIVEEGGIAVASNICDSLVDFDPETSELVAAAAEDWTISEDGRVFTINLREGAKFHNGREVVASDFVYAFHRIADPETLPAPSDISYHLAAIEGFGDFVGGTTDAIAGIKAVDGHTLEITLTDSFAEFMFVLGHPGLAPVPEEEVAKDPAAFGEMPICNGPFKMAGPWEHDEKIVVERFDDYYGDEAYLDTVTFKIFADQETAFLEFQSGNLDFTQIPAGQIEATVAEYGEGVHRIEEGKSALLGPENSLYYLNMNNKNEFLSNADLRRAISLALNRGAISTTVFEGTRKAATGVIPPGIVGFQADAGQYSVYDVEKAEEFLVKAGYAGGEGLPTFTLVYVAAGEIEKVMQVVQADLAVIGIKVELVPMEFGALIEHRAAGEHELAWDAWGVDYPIADNIMFALFHSDNVGFDNTTFFENAEVDTLMTDARKETDDDKRIAKIQNAESIIMDEAVVAPLVFYAHRAVAAKNVRDLIFSPLILPHLETAWLADGETS